MATALVINTMYMETYMYIKFAEYAYSHFLWSMIEVPYPLYLPSLPGRAAENDMYCNVH